MDSFTGVKHRDESEVYEIDFTNRLASGETISSVTALHVRKRNATSKDWANVSAEFGAPSGVINGTGKKVSFTLGAAAANEQLRGDYIVYCEVVTNTGEIVVETPWLSVDDPASTT